MSREPISTKSEPIGAAVRSVRLWSIVHSFVEAVVNNAQLRGVLRVRVKLREANTDESRSPAHGKRGLHSGARPRPNDCVPDGCDEERRSLRASNA